MIGNLNKIRTRIYYYLLCFYALCLPTLNNFTVPILVLLAVVTILDLTYLKQFWFSCKRDFVVIGLPLIFLLASISLFYTSNYESGLKNFFKFLPFLLTPLILFKVTKLSSKQLKTIYKLFVIGCAITIFYSFSYVLYELIDGSYKKLHSSENYLKYFLNRITYHDLVSKNRVDHSIYFGAYILLAISFLRTNRALFTNRVTSALLVIFYLTLCLLTPIIICIAGLVIFSLYTFISYETEVKKTKNKKLLIIGMSWGFVIFYLIVWKMTSHIDYIYIFNNLKYNIIIIIGVISVVILIFFTDRYYSNERFRILFIITFMIFFGYVLALMFIDLNMKSLPKSNFTARLANNFASANIIKDNFIFGVGLGDVQDNLKIIYREIRFRKLTYNEHNQYLRFWLSSGVFSFLIYSFWIYKVLINSIKQKNVLLISLSIVLFLFSFTETLLIRQMGSSFFLFFIFIFHFSSCKEVYNKPSA